ncbi:hypothetical protein CRENBAI_009436, partial [Crenichthys baileyi]
MPRLSDPDSSSIPNVHTAGIHLWDEYQSRKRIRTLVLHVDKEQQSETKSCCEILRKPVLKCSARVRASHADRKIEGQQGRPAHGEWSSSYTTRNIQAPHLVTEKETDFSHLCFFFPTFYFRVNRSDCKSRKNQGGLSQLSDRGGDLECTKEIEHYKPIHKLEQTDGKETSQSLSVTEHRELSQHWLQPGRVGAGGRQEKGAGHQGSEEQGQLCVTITESAHTVEIDLKRRSGGIKTISSNPPAKVVEIPEEPGSALTLDPIQELSEEEKDSSISEKRPLVSKHVTEPAKKQKVTASAVKKNPSIKKEMRSELERSVIKKLESLGVKPDQRGLTNQELTSLLAKVRSKQEAAAKVMPDYWRCREEMASFVEQKLGGQKRGNEAASESQARSKQPVQVLQVRPRSSSLPSRASQAISAAAVKQSKTPQPAPRTKALIQPKTSTPNMKSAVRISASKTPPFSSDEDSEDTEEELLQDQRVKSSNLRSYQVTAVEMKAGKPTPVLARQTAVSQPTSSKQHQSRASVGGVSWHNVSKLESDEDEDEDESDGSEMVEIDPRQLHGFKDQNGNIDKGNHNKDKVINLARKVEMQLAERAVKKPAGGVSILPERKDEVQELL